MIDYIERIKDRINDIPEEKRKKVEDYVISTNNEELIFDYFLYIKNADKDRIREALCKTKNPYYCFYFDRYTNEPHDDIKKIVLTYGNDDLIYKYSNEILKKYDKDVEQALFKNYNEEDRDVFRLFDYMKDYPKANYKKILDVVLETKFEILIDGVIKLNNPKHINYLKNKILKEKNDPRLAYTFTPFFTEKERPYLEEIIALDPGYTYSYLSTEKVVDVDKLINYIINGDELDNCAIIMNIIRDLLENKNLFDKDVYEKLIDRIDEFENIILNYKIKKYENCNYYKILKNLYKYSSNKEKLIDNLVQTALDPSTSSLLHIHLGHKDYFLEEDMEIFSKYIYKYNILDCMECMIINDLCSDIWVSKYMEKLIDNKQIYELIVINKRKPSLIKDDLLFDMIISENKMTLFEYAIDKFKDHEYVGALKLAYNKLKNTDEEINKEISLLTEHIGYRADDEPDNNKYRYGFERTRN